MKNFSKIFDISFLKKLSGKFLNKLLRLKYFNQFSWNPPYDYVQNITINNIYNYLEIPRESLKEWCIVGVHLGKEIKYILRKYPNVKIIGCECSKRYVKRLNKKFHLNPRVEIINKAISASKGEAKFYETSLQGNGSLFRLGELSKDSYGSIQKESFLVKTTTIDEIYRNKILDILWIDVQGAEKLVLGGSKNTLKKVKAVFIEISIKKNLYLNSSYMDEINDVLFENGFKLVLLGTDFNLTGNALYIKK